MTRRVYRYVDINKKVFIDFDESLTDSKSLSHFLEQYDSYISANLSNLRCWEIAFCSEQGYTQFVMTFGEQLQ